MSLIRRTAGLWGPAAFTAAAVVAARVQPGYSHRSLHISGLAALGQRSALVMLPGFMALGGSTLVMPVPDSTTAKLAKVAGAGVITAGLIPASQPRCPQPMADPDAQAIDVGHGIAAAVGFVAWTALPFVAASRSGPAWYRKLNRTLRYTTTAGCVGAAVTTRLDSSIKGVVQRLFLGSVFTWYVATAVRTEFG